MLLELLEVATAEEAKGPQLPDAIISLDITEPNGEKYGFNAQGDERRGIIVHAEYPVPDDSEIEEGKARNVIGKCRSVGLALQSKGVGVQFSSTLFVPVPKVEEAKTSTVAEMETEED